MVLAYSSDNDALHYWHPSVVVPLCAIQAEALAVKHENWVSEGNVISRPQKLISTSRLDHHTMHPVITSQIRDRDDQPIITTLTNYRGRLHLNYCFIKLTLPFRWIRAGINKGVI